MIEKDFSIITDDDQTIYGLINGPEGGSSKALILVHGLTGHMDEQHLIKTAYRFAKQGYDVFRFNLYGAQKDARKLENTTLAIHANDLNTTIDYVKSKDSYKWIGVAGHSYGGMTILHANPDADALVFWDSSFSTATIWENEAIIIDGKPTVNWGISVNIGEAMYKEGLNQTLDESKNLAKQIKAPSLVLHAAESLKTPAYKGVFDSLDCTKKLVVVEDADHCFTRLGNMDEALSAMNLWFKKYS